MTASDMQDLLTHTLARRAGGTQRRWRLAVGPVRVLDAALHPHCNWSVSASGTAQENEQIESLLDRVRLDHPILTHG